MRKIWYTQVIASVSAVAIAGSSALANPALMAARKPAPKYDAGANAAPRTSASLQGQAEVSPFKHPIQYLSANKPSFPSLPGFGKGKSTNALAPPTHGNDALSLSTPVGEPTPQLFISLAQMSESRGEIVAARESYQQALNRWPGQVDVLRAAARMEDRLGQLAVAESLYHQAVAANPQHAGALNDLGLCLARQGRLDESVQVIEQAIQLQPTKALYRNNAATVLVEMRQDQRALAHLATVHEAAEANYNFGQLLVQRGRAVDAMPYFQAAVEQDPQMQPAHVALAKLHGEAVAETATYTPPTTTQPQAPAVQPTAPVYAPQQGPQLSYPATARANTGYAPAYGGYIQGGVQTQAVPPVAARSMAPVQVQR